MKLSKIEMETVLNWNLAERVAYLYTHDKPLIRKLEQWRKERPDELKLERLSHEGKAADFILPRSWIHIYAEEVHHHDRGTQGTTEGTAGKGKTRLIFPCVRLPGHRPTIR